MALFDYILESSQFIHEGLLSSANMKSQLITVLLKIYNGKTDMADAKDIESALKKVRGVSKVEPLITLRSIIDGVTYYQHRYIVEDTKKVMYQIDIWNKPMALVSKTTVDKIYDPSRTNVPEKIVKDFLKEYVSLARKGFAGFPHVSKNTIGLYSYLPIPGKPDSPIVGMNYNDFKPDIERVMIKLANKYKDELEPKTKNELIYIG